MVHRRRARRSCRSELEEPLGRPDPTSAATTVHFLVSHPTPPVFDGRRRTATAGATSTRSGCGPTTYAGGAGRPTSTTTRGRRRAEAGSAVRDRRRPELRSARRRQHPGLDPAAARQRPGEHERHARQRRRGPFWAALQNGAQRHPWERPGVRHRGLLRLPAQCPPSPARAGTSGRTTCSRARACGIVGRRACSGRRPTIRSCT